MLSLALYGGCKDRLAKAYEADNGAGSAKAIPWDVILDMLMKLLGGCFPVGPSAAQLKESAKDSKKQDYLAYAVRSGLRQEYGLLAWRRYNGAGVCKAIVAATADADDSFLAAVGGACECDTQ